MTGRQRSRHKQDAEENLPLSARMRARLGLEASRPGSREGIYDELRARLGLGEPGIRSPQYRETSLRGRAERRVRREVGKSGERNRGLIVLFLAAIALMAAARYLGYKTGDKL